MGKVIMTHSRFKELVTALPLGQCVRVWHLRFNEPLWDGLLCRQSDTHYRILEVYVGNQFVGDYALAALRPDACIQYLSADEVAALRMAYALTGEPPPKPDVTPCHEESVP